MKDKRVEEKLKGLDRKLNKCSVIHKFNKIDMEPKKKATLLRAPQRQKYDHKVATAISSKGENRSIPDKMARKEIRQTERAMSQNKK